MFSDKKKILIIDDEADLIALAKQRLEAGGYRVFYAEDGEDGIKMAAKEKPDLILLDIMMPKKDGFEVLQHLKSDANMWNIPVVMLTVRTETEAMFKAKDLGAVDYFIKTDDWQELVKYISRYLSR